MNWKFIGHLIIGALGLVLLLLGFLVIQEFIRTAQAEATDFSPGTRLSIIHPTFGWIEVYRVQRVSQATGMLLLSSEKGYEKSFWIAPAALGRVWELKPGEKPR